MNKAKEINNKTNTELLIDYLEAIVADEMILNSFFRDLEVVASSETSVVIALGSSYAVDFVTKEYQNIVNQGLETIFEKNLEAKFIVKNQKFEELGNNTSLSSKNIAKKFTFANYVTSEFNLEVVQIANKVIDNPGKFSPLFITSKSGLGKTHILHAIGNRMSEKHYSCIYVEPNKFTKEISELSKQGNNALTDYVDHLKNYDVLIFDDIQNLGDRSVTLRVLFEIINNHIENDKQIIIASDKTTKELSGFESRFITRFNSGITTVIKDPTLDDLEKVLKSKLLWGKLNPEQWEDEALRFVVRNNSTSIRSLEGAIKRISFFCENEHKVNYTFNYIANIFKELEVDPIELTPQRILSTVCSYYRISIKDLTGKSRKHEIVVPRHIAIWLIKKILSQPLVEIGKIFSNRDHTTILASIRRIETGIQLDKSLKMAIEKIEQNIKSIN